VSSSSARLSTPEGPRKVFGAPNLPAGFTDTFTGRFIDAGGLRQHAVIGGEGPPLLLVHGWPRTWYAWRIVMPALARGYTVFAPDQRGMGLADKPRDGYDAGTLVARTRSATSGSPQWATTPGQHRLRAGRGSPGPGRPGRPRRDSQAPGVSLAVLSNVETAADDPWREQRSQGD
jgi:pimeloyl-ACP methyl ester carboxylesterase